MQFTAPRLITANFSITYQPVKDIRKLAFSLEEILNLELPGKLQPPLVLPPTLNPADPVIIFHAPHGLTRIWFSQINASFQVSYSPDWQENFSKCKMYLQERLPLFFRVIKKFEELVPLYSGLMLYVEIRTDGNVNLEELCEYFARKWMAENKDLKNLIFFELKRVWKLENMFYINIASGVYAKPNQSEFAYEIIPLASPASTISPYQRLPESLITERGLFLISDVNDRYAFNSQENYFTTPEACDRIISLSFEIITQEIDFLFKEE